MNKDQEKYSKLKDEITNLSNFINIQSPHESKQFLECLNRFNDLYYYKFSLKESITIRKKNINILISTQAIELFRILLGNLFTEIFYKNYYINLNLSLYKSIKNILDLFIYSIDASWKFSEEICSNKLLLDFIYRIIQKFKPFGLCETLSRHHIQILNDTITIPYTISINGNPEQIAVLHSMKFVELIQDFLLSPYERIKLNSLLLIAHLSSESHFKLEIIQEKRPEYLSYLTQLLNKYMTDYHGQTRAFSILELARGIEKLSKVDENKRILVKCGILPVLMLLIKNKSTRYKKISLSILWNLAFNKKNRQVINSMFSDIISDFRKDRFPLLYGTLTKNDKRKTQNDLELRNVTENLNETEKMPRKTYINVLDGLKWILQDHRNNSKTRDACEDSNEISERETHFMISYSHSNAKIVMDIYQILQKQGFKVWIDKYNINDDENMMEAMAQAVENSIAVIIFLSTKYKNSEYCRSEAQYAFKLNKPLIPVVVEKEYHPDGWLGLCISGLQYFDFTSKTPFKKSMALLTDQISTIKNRRFSKIFEKSDFPKEPSVPSNPSPNNWTHEEVKTWLKKIGVRKIKWKANYAGQDIMFLKSLSKEKFLDICRIDFKMSDLKEMRIFYEELEKLL